VGQISTWGWIVVTGTAWLAVAVVVAALIGRTIRQRDRQAARGDAPDPGFGAPADRGGDRRAVEGRAEDPQRPGRPR
jgi:hypothetical protein